MLAKSKKNEPWAATRTSKPSERKNEKHLPKIYKMRRYYTPEEINLHNTSDDCHVSFFGFVYDLTQLLAKNRKANADLCEPIERVAGSDITHWFDPITLEVSPLLRSN